VFTCCSRLVCDLATDGMWRGVVPNVHNGVAANLTWTRSTVAPDGMKRFRSGVCCESQGPRCFDGAARSFTKEQEFCKKCDRETGISDISVDYEKGSFAPRAHALVRV